jgi:Glycosyltransferase
VEAGYETVLIVQNHADDNRDGIRIKALSMADNRRHRITQLLWQGLKMVIEEKPALCHFHDPELIPAGILIKLMGIKVAYDVHEDYPRSLLSSDRTWLPAWCRSIASKGVSVFEWLGACFFDGIIAATPAIAKRFPSQKTITLQNYPILDELRSESSLPYRNRLPMLTYTGVISLLRGIRELIKALDFLPGNLESKLLLAGKFDSHEFEKEVKQLPGWKHVDFKGLLSRKEVADLFGQAKVGLVVFHPVPNHVEAQPNKLFEYMSAGIPVVASDFPLWREIIGGADCGLLVDPLDPVKIAEAIKWLLENPDDAEAMGKRGKQAVEEKYNWDIEKKKLLTFYEKVLA